MRHAPSVHGRYFIPAAAVAALGLAAMPSGRALAEGLLGLYAGGAVGQAQVKASAPTFGDFNKHHSAFKVLIGARPISLVGAELAYVDFGHPSTATALGSADASMKGAAAFGMLYLPVPIVDVYLKAGLARLQSTLNAVSSGVLCTVTAPNCQLFRLDRTNTSFAAGAGVQFKFGALAVRGEYERFNAAGGNPGLVSLGATWTFL
jgi:opacity protein-like surface antigen